MNIWKLILDLVIISMISIVIFLSLPIANLQVIRGEIDDVYRNAHTPDDFISFNHKNYLMKDVLIYKNKLLTVYWFMTFEGFAVEKTNWYAERSSELKSYRFLNFSKHGNFVNFNSKKYKIEYQRGDTIISTEDDNKIIVFIGNTN